MVDVTSKCSNLQLCAGLWSGIKANLHAIQAIWPQSARCTEDGVSIEEHDGDLQDSTTMQCICAEGLLAPEVDPGAAEDANFSCYECETGIGSALFDACNGFN